MKLHNQAKEMIDRFRMNYLNEIRGCIFLKPISKLFVGGKEIGPFDENQQVELENWIIDVLMANEIVEIVPDDEYEALSQIQRIYQQEKRQSGIQNTNSLMYVAIRERIRHLQGDRTSPDPIGQEDIGKFENLLRNMSEIRLSKIIQIAKSGAYQDTQKQMTHEERWLCEEIIEILSEWRHYVKE